jgi:hypothetical protein
LFGCEAWSVSLREEQRVRANRERVTGDRRKLHDEELHDLYLLPDTVLGSQIKQDEMGRACGMHKGDEKCMQGFGRKD